MEIAWNLKKDDITAPEINIADDTDRFIRSGDDGCLVRWWKE